MKRIAVIIMTFIVITVLVSTSCTCKIEEGRSCRGIGYECMMASVCFSDSCDSGSTGQDSLRAYDFAAEGKYYSKPQITMIQNGDSVDLTVKMEVYKRFRLAMEICIVQDGVEIGKFTYYDSCDPEEDFRVHTVVHFNELYNQDGGPVYYILNSFSARVSV